MCEGVSNLSDELQVMVLFLVDQAKAIGWSDSSSERAEGVACQLCDLLIGRDHERNKYLAQEFVEDCGAENRCGALAFASQLSVEIFVDPD